MKSGRFVANSWQFKQLGDWPVKNLFRTGILSTAALGLSALAASAQSYSSYYCSYYGYYCNGGGGGTTDVPEIDAASGLMAMAAVVAMLMLAWEIKRRRA